MMRAASGWAARGRIDGSRSTSVTLKPSSCKTAAILTPANEAPMTAARSGSPRFAPARPPAVPGPRRRPPSTATRSSSTACFRARASSSVWRVKALRPAPGAASPTPTPRAAPVWAAPPAWRPTPPGTACTHKCHPSRSSTLGLRHPAGRPPRRGVPSPGCYRRSPRRRRTGRRAPVGSSRRPGTVPSIGL